MGLPPFLRYLVVGAGAFVFDYLLFLSLLRLLGIDYLFANAAGFIGGFFCSFLLNGRYTFDLSGELGRPFLRYCLLALFSLALGSLLLHAFVQALSMTPEAAKIGVSLLTVCWNFLLYRHFVFREAAA
jgi:putative flippase GtrA